MNNLRINQILANNSLIAKSHLQKVHNEQINSSLKLGEILVQKGLISRLQVRQVLLQKQLLDLMSCVLLTLNTFEFSFLFPLPALPDQHRSRDLNNIYVFSRIAIGSSRNSKPSSSLNLGTTSWGKQSYLSQAQPDLKPTIAPPLEGFCHPLNGKGYLSQGIRSGIHQGRMEYAYDLASPIGTPVYAMKAGRVIGVQDKYPDTGGGKENASRFNYIQLEHSNGYRSSYIHLQQGFSRVSIKTGSWVKAGELIGYTGNSGWSTAPHLHIEVSQASRQSKFSQIVPFRISGTCGTLAQEPA